jgi:hypothetical protein
MKQLTPSRHSAGDAALASFKCPSADTMFFAFWFLESLADSLAAFPRCTLECVQCMRERDLPRIDNPHNKGHTRVTMKIAYFPLHSHAPVTEV